MRLALIGLLMRVLIGSALPFPVMAEVKLLVTVVDPKTGEAVTDLKAADFAVDDRGAPRAVLNAEFTSTPVDAVLLVDASQVGLQARSVARGLIAGLGASEQMSMVGFDTSPEQVQEFTSDKALLTKAIDQLKPGRDPDVVGAVYASADTGFQKSRARRVILLISAGRDAGGRVSPEATLKTARKNMVSVFLISPQGVPRWIEELAERTGGATFNLREMSKTVNDPATGAGQRILAAARGHYTLTLAGNLALGEKLKIEVPAKGKFAISSLPLD